MGWLFERPSVDDANHWLALLSLALFAIGVIASAVISTRPRMLPIGRKQTQKFMVRACTIIGWICGIGLFFGIIRVLQIDPATLGRPIWIVLTWIALIAAIGYLVYISPADREQRRANEERRRHRQSLQRSGKSGSRGRAKV